MNPSAKRWQQSYSGKVVHPQDLRPEEVTLADIPHALAQKIRFNGQCTVMGYTVAQHTVLGARALLAMKAPKEIALAFLLHEVSEVYLPDIPSPIKLLTYVTLPGCSETQVSWHDFEKQHAASILEAIGRFELLPLLDDPRVKDMDIRMLITEKRDLMGPEPQPWGFTEAPLTARITDIWEPAYAELQWASMYERLTGEKVTL